MTQSNVPIENNEVIRCDWVGNDLIYQNYHDEEWGVPVKDDYMLFEMLCLEGAQAGLSWITILKRRDGYRELFDHFDPYKIINYTDEDLEKILLNPKIVRNRLKVFSVRSNAVAYMNICKEFKDFSSYIWQFVDYKQIVNHFEDLIEFPVTSPESDKMSKDLKKRGFKFVGSTICYAYMQAVGMVNDHQNKCFKTERKNT